MAESGRTLSKAYVLAQLALKALASDVAAMVAATRSISTTAPLTGGGDLSQNRTLAVSGATATAQGVVELATDAEVQAATDNGRACTPQGVASRTATETRTGVIELATTAEATTGTDTARGVTPAGLKTVGDTKVASNEARVTADQAVGTASIRTLGSGALQGAPGNDARFKRPLVLGLQTQTSVPVTAVAGIQEYIANRRLRLDLDLFTDVRLVHNTTTAGQAGTLLLIQYSTDATTWTDLITSSLAATGLIDTGWVAAPTGAKVANVYLRMASSGWTATPTAVNGPIYLQFR